MKDNKIVVYMDASFSNAAFNAKRSYDIGLGVYMIDAEGNDLKIAKGFTSKKITKSSSAEIAALNFFCDYVSRSTDYHDKTFVIYSDSEDVVALLNNIDNYSRHSLKPDFIEKLKELNIQEAYWVKGHAKETGNLTVDTLAYNALRMSLDNNDTEYESISVNKSLHDIFDDVKRCPKRYLLTKPNADLNADAYARRFNIENNVVSKRDSLEYQDMEKKIKLVKDGDGYVARIGYEYGVFSLNGVAYPEKSFSKIIDFIISDHSRLGELRRNALIKISFQNVDFVDKIEGLYHEAGLHRKALHELSKAGLAQKSNEMKVAIYNQKQFLKESELHEVASKMEKNSKLLVSFQDHMKPKFKR